MNPNDHTGRHTPQLDDEGSNAAWDAGLAAAFGVAETRSYTAPADPEPGAVIAGKYRLSERIGEGGMGSVWVAHQTEPVKRKVAVKLIKAGMDSKSVLARFEAERQALAVMDHPNIAKVLDGGLHDNRPFFVMELVKGVPITEYCDARKLTPRERLELFVPVCQAIQHAHQKGIIHRDIKPSNVLIALYDDKPVPKVIDFGVAKATGGTLTEQTIETAFGGVVGTPQYMSPEQATLNNLDIDTRSDVYALGVLLYELLTGSPPFARAELEKRGLLEMLRVVREEEPPRPSTRLSTADALPSLSASRGTDPKKLAGLLRNELDWIVMKALEKDRSRRYETANGFATDINRYLAGEPVRAHPPSTAYRLKKFVRRNRGQVLAASLVLLALVAGFIGTTLGLIEAKRQEELADERRLDAVAAQQSEARRAEGELLAKLEAQKQERLANERADGEKKARLAEAEANAQAQARAKQLEKSNEIISGIFADLDIRKVKEGTEPLEAVLAKRLERAAEQLEGEAVGDPLVVAGLQNRLGVSLLSLGYASSAVALFEKCWVTANEHLGPDHPDALTSMSNLAEAYRDAGKLALALPLFEETLKLRKVKLGPDHPDTLISMGNLAGAYRETNKLDLALPLFEETLKLMKAKLGPDYPDTLTTMNNLALAYLAAGKLALALPLFEETLKLRKAKLGPEHPDTLATMNNLAMAYRQAGKLDLTLPLLEETLKLATAKLGPDHPATLTTMNNLALAYLGVGKLDLALPLFEETLKLQKAKLGPDHPATFTTMNNFVVAYRQAGKLDVALPLLEETLRLRKAKLRPDYPGTLSILARLLLANGDAGKARALAKEMLLRERARLPKDSPQLAGTLAMASSSLLKLNDFVEAEPLLRECLAIREKRMPDDWLTFSTKSVLGEALLRQKKYAEAEPLLLAGYEGMKQREKTIPAPSKIRLTEALDRLIELYTTTDKPDDVKKWRAERAKYSDVALPPREVK